LRRLLEVKTLDDLILDAMEVEESEGELSNILLRDDAFESRVVRMDSVLSKVTACPSLSKKTPTLTPITKVKLPELKINKAAESGSKSATLSMLDIQHLNKTNTINCSY